MKYVKNVPNGWIHQKREEEKSYVIFRPIREHCTEKLNAKTEKIVKNCLCTFRKHEIEWIICGDNESHFEYSFIYLFSSFW